jgi:excisionase family DNA binding protein
MSGAEVVRVTVDGDSPVAEECTHPRPDRSGRPVKTRRNRRPDRRRVKLLRSYTIDEVARTLGVHRNTVRHWIKAGLRIIDDKRPILILGSDLAEYLSRRREARRQPCRAGQMFCLKCRKPQEPAGRMADFVASSATSGALVAICPACNRLIYRRVSVARLSEVAGALDVHITRAQPRIKDTAIPNLNCHLGHEV